MYPVSDIPLSLLDNAKAVVREDIGIFDVKSASEATFKIRMAVTIFKERNGYEVMPLYYSKYSKIKNIRAKYYDALGNMVRKVEKEEIKDIALARDGTLYSDARCKYIENNYGTLPYTFELEYEVQYNNIQHYPDWTFQHYDVAIQKSEFSISLPNDLDIKYKVFNATIPETKTIEGNRSIYKWTVANLTAVKSEPFAPTANKVLPYLEISPSKFSVEGLEGSMNDWSSFGKFLYDLSAGADSVTPEFALKIKQMTMNCKTDFEKIDTLYHYMQRNMRYVSVQIGIGGWKPYEATYVEKNKYGDCKALSNFMRAMLKSVGINSNLAVISAGSEEYSELDSTFCNPNSNHMILYVPSEKMWLECTSDNAPTGYLGSFTQGRSALLITEDGGRVVYTPRQDSLTNSLINKANIQLHIDGGATVESYSTIKGVLQDDIRMEAAMLSKDDFQKNFRENQKLSNFSIEKLDTEVNKNQPIVSLSYKIKVEKYASKAGNRLFVPINLLNVFDKVPAPVENRHLPIDTGNKEYIEQLEYVFMIPEGFSVESIAGSKTELHSKYGDYTSIVEQKDDKTIVFKRKLTIKRTQEEAAKYNDFRDFYKKIQQADSAKMILKGN